MKIYPIAHTPPKMTIKQLLLEAQKELEYNNIENADLDVQLLLGSCLKLNRTQMLLRASETVNQSICEQFKKLVSRRLTREPVAYILKEKEFWSRPFFVNSEVLIPRPETEYLLERVLTHVKENNITLHRCMDLCCGSGVIAIVLALELNCKVVALDCSDKALGITRKNAKQHGVEDLVTPLCSNLFSAVDNNQRFPLIVSNPPYVRSHDVTHTLLPEVSVFEPHLALDGGRDGLDCIREIARDILTFLSPNGIFFMEFGADQADDIKEIFSVSTAGKRYFEGVEIYKDYSNRDRVLYAKINKYDE